MYTLPMIVRKNPYNSGGRTYWPGNRVDLEPQKIQRLVELGLIDYPPVGYRPESTLSLYPSAARYHWTVYSVWTATTPGELRTYRTRHTVVGGACDNLAIDFLNYSTTPGGEVSQGNAVHLVAVAIEYPLGRLVPVSSEGLNIPPNSSMRVSIDIDLPAGAVYWIRACYKLALVGDNLCGGYASTPAQGEGSVTGNAALSTSPIESSGRIVLPWVYTTNKRKCITVIGDSITQGDGAGGLHWVQKASLRSDVPVLSMATTGDSLGTWDGASSPYRLMYLNEMYKGGSVLIALGVNDILGASVNTCVARACSFAKRLRDHYSFVGISTIVPRVDNPFGIQTPVAGSEPKRTQYNTWVRSRPRNFDFIFDMSKAIEAPDTVTWVPGTNLDTVHPNSAGDDAIANSFADSIQKIAF